MKNTKAVEWVLRIAVAGEFIGHGVFAIGKKPGWIEYFTAVGFTEDMALTLLPLIGAMDIALAILILVKPIKIAVLWMAFWGFATALIRPIAGEPIWDFVERFANIGAPLALLLVLGVPKTVRGWFR